METATDTLPVPITPFERWDAGEIGIREAATAIATQLIDEVDPQTRILEVRRNALRAQLGTLLIRIGEPLEVRGRVARWVEPTTAETVNVKKLRVLIAELRGQGIPALDGIARRIEACITISTRRGYPMIESPPRSQHPIATHEGEHQESLMSGIATPCDRQ